jgi:hypothetical protein
MCFSAPVSFAASAVLVTTGSYCVKTSIDKNKRYLLLACIPLIFGLQQFCEGLVWLSIQRGDPGFIKLSSLGFMFFAFALWPIMAPLAVFFIEKKENGTLKKFLFILTLVGIAVGLLVYLPLILGGVAFTTDVINYSINYETARPLLLKAFYVGLYLLAVVPAFFIASEKRLKYFGGLLVLSILLALVANYAAFYSVWCFFSAIFSAYIGYIIYQLPKNSPVE